MEANINEKNGKRRKKGETDDNLPFIYSSPVIFLYNRELRSQTDDIITVEFSIYHTWHVLQKQSTCSVKVQSHLVIEL